MSAPVNTFIQGVTYYRAVGGGSRVFGIVPFDQNGNLIKEINIVCDRSDSGFDIELPSTLNLGGRQITIKIVVERDDFMNRVTVRAKPTPNHELRDTIQGLTEFGGEGGAYAGVITNLPNKVWLVTPNANASVRPSNGDNTTGG